MAVQTIDAERLKTIRKARKIGRPKLAKLSGLTERKVAKLEASAGQQETLPEVTIERLSHALQIPALVLTGDLPMDESDLQAATKSSCTSGCCG